MSTVREQEKHRLTPVSLVKHFVCLRIPSLTVELIRFLCVDCGSLVFKLSGS